MTNKEKYCQGRADYLSGLGYSLSEGYKIAEKEWEANQRGEEGSHIEYAFHKRTKEDNQYFIDHLDDASDKLSQASSIRKS